MELAGLVLVLTRLDRDWFFPFTLARVTYYDACLVSIDAYT